MHGGAVVIDVPTGAVRALASWPKLRREPVRRAIRAAVDRRREPAAAEPSDAGATARVDGEAIVGVGAITDGCSPPSTASSAPIPHAPRA